jgi:DDE domain
MTQGFESSSIIHPTLHHFGVETRNLERTIEWYAWVQHYAPELERRCHLHLKPTTDSWRVDETSIKVKKKWVYLSRAVDSKAEYARFLFEPDERCSSGETLLVQNPRSVSYHGVTWDQRGQKCRLPQSVR